MGGIEPPSTAVILRLLRVYPLTRSTRPRPLTRASWSTGPAEEQSRMTSRLRHPASPLDDARIRDGDTLGLTDYRARLSSEGEVSALRVGTCCFAEIVNEITLHPRPASRSFAGNVETDHPHGLSASENEAKRVVVTRCRVVNPPRAANEHLAVQLSSVPRPKARVTYSPSRFLVAIARAASRVSCFSRRACRLSYSFLPFATAISTLALPSLK